VSAALIVLVIRTRRPFFRSAPNWRLLLATVLVVMAAIVIPFTPLSGPLGLARIPAVFFGALAGILAAYALAAEVAKWLFYRAHDSARTPHVGNDGRKGRERARG
jgi:Mg2+-importing ATPase